MEIVLTVIGVLAFFGGSYFIGNWIFSFEDDTSQDKFMRSFFGMLVMLVAGVLVGLVSVGIYQGVVLLMN